jgi:hypothetical protein
MKPCGGRRHADQLAQFSYPSDAKRRLEGLHLLEQKRPNPTTLDRVVASLDRKRLGARWAGDEKCRAEALRRLEGKPLVFAADIGYGN